MFYRIKFLLGTIVVKEICHGEDIVVLDRIYKVLVSEFMLQQTQVKTVIPFLISL
jgi:adenine-specific DNA glycosylase